MNPSLPIPPDGSVNVYDATSDAYVTNIRLNENAVHESPFHDLRVKRHPPTISLDPFAPDYRDLFIEKGTVVAPDAILHAMRPSALNIPLKSREDFADSDALPDSDLVRAINYYASSSRIESHSMEETSLLALGLLLEQWADEELDTCASRLFMEPEESLDLSKYAAPDSDINGENSSSESPSNSSSDDDSEGPDSEKDSARWSSEDSDIMSIELSESDTASEVEGGRQRKKRKPSAFVLRSEKPEVGDKSSSLSSNSDSSEDSSSSSKVSSTSGSESSDSDFGIEGFGSLKKTEKLEKTEYREKQSSSDLDSQRNSEKEGFNFSNGMSSNGYEKKGASADTKDVYEDASSESDSVGVQRNSSDVHSEQESSVKPHLDLMDFSESDQ